MFVFLKKDFPWLITVWCCLFNNNDKFLVNFHLLETQYIIIVCGSKIEEEIMANRNNI